jgi:hypothetical protein
VAGRPEAWVAVIDIEIESADSAADFRGRMFEYYTALRREYGLPVLPVALFMRVGMEGVGRDGYEEDFWDLPVVRFQYAYVGLPALPAEEYVERGNPVGVALAALMRVPKDRRAWLKATAYRQAMLLDPGPWRTRLLADCIEAYLPLDEAEERRFRELLEVGPFQEVRAMPLTIYERAELEGKAAGRAAGEIAGAINARREMLRELLEARFGPLPTVARQRIDSLPVERLRELGLALLKAGSLRELGLED